MSIEDVAPMHIYLLNKPHANQRTLNFFIWFLYKYGYVLIAQNQLNKNKNSNKKNIGKRSGKKRIKKEFSLNLKKLKN